MAEEQYLSGMARGALKLVEAHVRMKVGNYGGAEAFDALWDAAQAWRDSEIPEGDLIPLVDAETPMPDDAANTRGSCSFYVTSGGAEFDHVLVNYRFNEDGRMEFTFEYEGTEERFEYPKEDENAAEE